MHSAESKVTVQSKHLYPEGVSRQSPQGQKYEAKKHQPNVLEEQCLKQISKYKVYLDTS